MCVGGAANKKCNGGADNWFCAEGVAASFSQCIHRLSVWAGIVDAPRPVSGMPWAAVELESDSSGEDPGRATLGDLSGGALLPVPVAPVTRDLTRAALDSGCCWPLGTGSRTRIALCGNCLIWVVKELINSLYEQLRVHSLPFGKGEGAINGYRPEPDIMEKRPPSR